MMKTYMKPQIDVRQIEIESMICTSGIFDSALNEDNTITSADQILSKKNSFDLWTDEED
jgi:hypothetical protein